MFQKVRHAVTSASLRKDIYDRRMEIRNLKAEWGCCLFDASNKSDKDEVFRSSLMVLEQAIKKKQEEIHEIEEKLVILPDVLGQLVSIKKQNVESKEKITCDTCYKPVTKEQLLYANFHVHPECFLCNGCNSNLSTQSKMFSFELKPYCQGCGEQRILSSVRTLSESKLLEWVQEELKDFYQVDIRDFEPMAWRNGLGFPALCVRFCPEVFKWKKLIEGMNEDHPLKCCQTGLDGLYKAGAYLLFEEADYLRDADSKSLMLQIMIIRNFVFHKFPFAGKGLQEWNTKLKKIPLKHFEKSNYLKEFESLDKTGVIKEAERILEDRNILISSSSSKSAITKGTDTQQE